MASRSPLRKQLSIVSELARAESDARLAIAELRDAGVPEYNPTLIELIAAHEEASAARKEADAEYDRLLGRVPILASLEHVG